MTTYDYHRVSHRESAAAGNSKEAQVADCRRLAASLGLTIDKTFTDLAVSAYKVNIALRPQGKLLCDALKPGDTVIFRSVCRGFRSMRDFANTVGPWVDKGINVHIVQNKIDLTTANGKLMAHILAAFAQWKSDMHSERVKSGLAMRKQRQAEAKLKEKKLPEKVIKMEGPPILSGPPAPEPEQPGSSPVRCLGYVRVSHVKSLPGSSLDYQTQQIQAQREKMGLEGETFKDAAVSAYKKDFLQRPGGARLHKQLRKGDHVVITSMSRGFRRTQDLLNTYALWRDMGVSLHILDSGIDTSTMTGQVMMTVLALFSELESADISSRSTSVARSLKERGLKYNRVPFGYKAIRHDGRERIVLDRESLQWMWYAHFLKSQGWSYDKIDDYFEELVAYKNKRKPVPRGGIERHIKCPGARVTRRGGKTSIRRWFNKKDLQRMVTRWPAMKEHVAKLKAETAQ